MKLKSFNYLIGLLVFLLFLPSWSEEKIDIWKNNTNKNIEASNPSTQNTEKNDNTKVNILLKITK